MQEGERGKRVCKAEAEVGRQKTIRNDWQKTKEDVIKEKVAVLHIFTWIRKYS